MKRFLLFLTCSLLVLSVAAQPVSKALPQYNKGMEFLKTNMFPDAEICFRKAILLDKKYDSSYLQIARLYVMQGRTDTAILYFNKVTTINPRNVIAQIEFGNLYRDLIQNFDSALIRYSNALKLDSLNKVTLYSIAWCYNAKKEYEKAIPYAAKALEIDNNYRPAYGELGHAFHYSKNYQAGIDQFKKNIAISPPVDLPYFYSGMCYIQLNQKDDALKMYDELQKLNPKLAGSLKKRIDEMK